MSKHTYPTIDHVREVTQFKSKKQAEGAIEALKWLDDGAPHKFDGLKGNFKFAMDVFLMDVQELSNPEPDDCGTACCIAGAIWAFTKDMNGNRPSGKASMDIFKTDPDCSDPDYPELHPDLHSLFYADDHYLDDITPAQAAKTLRKYLKKGKVDWSHLDD
jgi:hypothetical protein